MIHQNWSMSVVLLCILLCFSTLAHSVEKPIICIYSGMDENTLKHAHQSGVSIIMPSVTWYDSSPLKSNVDLAHKYGLKVYPSLATAFDGYQEKLSSFAKTHPQYWEKRKDGSLLDSGTEVNLSWGYPEVRNYKVKSLTDFVIASGFDGILLDYTRYFGNQTGYSNIIVQEFKDKYKRDPNGIVADDPQWVNFRAEYVTRFVGDLSKSLKAANRKIKIMACVGPDPCECLRNSMNDWKGWLERGYIDGVITMIYERDTNNTLKNIAIAEQAIAGRVPLIPMIACWNGNLDTPEMLIEGSRKCLQAGCPGIAYYRSDAIYDLNLWPSIREVAQWDLQQIRNTPINYMLNAGFENNFENWSIGDASGVEISTSNYHAGKKSLKLSLCAQPSVRQIIDRGFLTGYKTVGVSFWLNTTIKQTQPSLFLTLTMNYKDGHEFCYRIPVKPEYKTNWSQWNFDVPVHASENLNFIIIEISGKAEAGEVWIDSLNLNLTKFGTDPNEDTLRPEKVNKNEKNINLARGQLVQSSSFWENGFQPEYAVDGSLSTENGGKYSSWISQRPAKDQWIKIYLPHTYSVSRVRMLNSSLQYCYRTKDFKIEASTDDLHYKVIASGTLPNDDSTWTEVKISPTTARYIKFTGLTGYHPDYAVGLKEIELY